MRSGFMTFISPNVRYSQARLPTQRQRNNVFSVKLQTAADKNVRLMASKKILGKISSKSIQITFKNCYRNGRIAMTSFRKKKYDRNKNRTHSSFIDFYVWHPYLYDLIILCHSQLCTEQLIDLHSLAAAQIAQRYKLFETQM